MRRSLDLKPISSETPLASVKMIHKKIWNCVLMDGVEPLVWYSNDCALCEYAEDVRRELYNKCDGLFTSGTIEKCAFCPAKCVFESYIHPYIWTKETHVPCLCGLHTKWFLEKDDTIAKQIRDIEFVSKRQIDDRFDETLGFMNDMVRRVEEYKV